jgi:hypothetical protein
LEPEQIASVLKTTKRDTSPPRPLAIKVPAIISQGVFDQVQERLRILADCRAGKIATVIVQDPERLSRRADQLAALLRTFNDAKVRVELATGGDPVRDLPTRGFAVGRYGSRRP